MIFGFDTIDEAFDVYDARVKSFFSDKPKERFLEFDVFSGDGWRELCQFVGAEIPDIPFPRENATPGQL